jgi:putative glutamine amidotransferase
LAQAQEAFVNSHHHQAIETVGKDLIATAWSSDGLIEAVEDPRPKHSVFGVQWHPELGWQRDHLSRALFDRFIAATHDYAASKEDADAETVGSGRERA